MAYATPQDLVDRFGEHELVRLTTPAGQDLDAVRTDLAERVLAEVSAVMDSYIRKRYQTPIAVSPDEVRLCCMDLARYELSTGDGKTPGEDVKDRQKARMDWLRDISLGRVTLELDEVTTGDESFAQVSTHEPAFHRGAW